MHSCAYEGTVRHRRSGDVNHEFSYPIFFPYLDLDELDAVLSRTLLWSATRPALARFKREDFMGDPRQPLAESVRDVVEDKVGLRPEGPVRMLANLRYFGHLFNPVSFFFCFDAGGQVAAVAAEVTNTPWGERHVYALAGREGTLPKDFHVSPLRGMDDEYRWRVSEPGETLSVHIGSSGFKAGLSLRRQGLNLDRLLLRYPALTARIVARIYWQAARLRLKGAPYFAHPQRSGA